MKDLIEIKEYLEGEKSCLVVMAYLIERKGSGATAGEIELKKIYDVKADTLDKVIKMIDEKFLKSEEESK